MEIIDCQIHVPPDIPALFPGQPRSFHDAVAVRATISVLDAAGVNGAILNWTGTLNETAFESHPDRFRTVTVFEPHAGTLRKMLSSYAADFPTEELVLPFAARDDLAATVDQLRARTGLVSLRCEPGFQPENGWHETAALFVQGAYDPLFVLGRELNLPVCLWIAGALESVARVAEEFPDVSLVLDHAGLIPTVFAGADPDQEIPQLLSLARYPNIAVKMSGIVSRSNEQYPFRDLWPFVRSVVDTFGPDRVMWGTDYTMHPDKTYADTLHYLLHTDVLTDVEKVAFFGANLRTIFKWTTPDAVAAT